MILATKDVAGTTEQGVCLRASSIPPDRGVVDDPLFLDEDLS